MTLRGVILGVDAHSRLSTFSPLVLPMLERFLAERCARPTTVLSLYDSFVALLSPAESTFWPRSRFVAEASRLGYELGQLDRRQALFPPVAV